MQRKEICQSPKMRNSRSSTRTRVRVRAYWLPKQRHVLVGSRAKSYWVDFPIRSLDRISIWVFATCKHLLERLTLLHLLLCLLDIAFTNLKLLLADLQRLLLALDSHQARKGLKRLVGVGYLDVGRHRRAEVWRH